LRRKLEVELVLELLDRGGVFQGWLGVGMSERAEDDFLVASRITHFSKLANEKDATGGFEPS
jgi:hypothetical protein